jgi:thermostable 8-oxoguanine DNA glycosylase
MQQVVYKPAGSGHRALELPDPNEEVMPGVQWGRADQLFTAAYWASQIWLRDDLENPPNHRLGRTIREEVAACLLGGHGIPAEIGLAAYGHLRDLHLLDPPAPSLETIQATLSQPIPTRNGVVHYRFARQKSTFLYEFLAGAVDTEPTHLTDRQFRDWLMRFKGIGPKTASWITRNWRDSDEVAIIDIHIFRAGLLIGLFSPVKCPTREYSRLEALFLEFATRIGVRLSALDALIWEQMRKGARLCRQLLTSVKTEMGEIRSVEGDVKRGGRKCLEATMT